MIRRLFGPGEGRTSWRGAAPQSVRSAAPAQPPTVQPESAEPDPGCCQPVVRGVRMLQARQNRLRRGAATDLPDASESR
ncbi:MAG TPA: hypothetical protein VF981_04765 [Gemmatimonadaceae bacterium]